MTDAELSSVLNERLAQVTDRIAAACRRVDRDPTEVTLLTVTKTVSPRVAAAMAALGVHDLGESRPQELWRKAEAITEIRWHLTGHLQRNKIERTIPLVSLVHSVDSLRLLRALDEFGRNRGIIVPILLEVNCGRENAKGGFVPDEMPSIADTVMPLTGVRVEGLMTMAPYHEDPERCRPVFAELSTLRDRFQKQCGLRMSSLSMGMSNDYPIAIEEGATIVRLGTTLFEGLDAE